MEDKIFDIAFDIDSKKYKGWVNPSDEMNDTGQPISFHVVLNDVSFGYLSYKDCKWMVNEERPDELVKEVGKEIEKHYGFDITRNLRYQIEGNQQAPVKKT